MASFSLPLDELSAVPKAEECDSGVMQPAQPSHISQIRLASVKPALNMISLQGIAGKTTLLGEGIPVAADLALFQDELVGERLGGNPLSLFNHRDRRRGRIEDFSRGFHLGRI